MRAYTDGACRVSNPGQCSCAFVVYDDASDLPCSSSYRYLGPGLRTNNFAEYQGLLDLLKWAEVYGVKGIRIHTDSDLVMRQVNGIWKVKHAELQPLRDLAYALLVRGNHGLFWIRGHEQADKLEDRIGNTLVDKLCNKVLDKELNGNPKELL